MELAPTPLAPNHHADRPGFAGARGLAFGLLMAAVGGGDARLAVRLAEVGPTDHVVDIGSGPGTAVRAAARRGATAIGVEPAPVMRRIARVLGWGSRRATVVRGVAEALPLPDASATVVWSLATVHHWPQLEEGVAEVLRVLRPGGRFLVIERRSAADATGLASHGWRPEQAEAFAGVCRATGFVDVRVEAHRGGRRGDVLAVLASKPS